MIPQTDALLVSMDEAERVPSRTWSIADGRLNALIDGKEAMAQAITLICWCERFEHLIYSWDYGIETGALFGKEPDFVVSELKRVITEALEQDDRIISVEGFAIDEHAGAINCRFVVNTIFGQVEATHELRYL